MSKTSDKYGGKAKQAVGRLTGNKKLQAKGKLQEAKADLRRSFDNSFNDFK